MSRMASGGVLWLAIGMAWVSVDFARAADAPKVVSLTPENGATNVDPSIRTIRIVFDQDMKAGSHSLCGGGDSFPKLRGQPRWDDARTFVCSVSLEPEHEYVTSVNCQTFTAFQSVEGVSAEPTPWRFTTGAAKSRGKVDQKKLNGQCLDELMKALRRNYSHYDRTGTDWPARAKKSRMKIVAAKSTKAWVDAVAKFLSAAEDPHIWITYKGKTTGTYQRKYTPNITLRGIEAEIGKLERRNDNALVTQIEGDIAYINIPSWSGGKKAEIEALQGILAEKRGSKAMIIDVRGNSGGDESLARGVAAWFVEGAHVYAKHQFRDASAEGGFGPVMERKIVGNEGVNRFEGPVAVLMGPVNISSCESFLLMMRQGRHVTLIGIKSGGSSGNPQPFVLENDVEVYIPSWKDIQLDGTSLEGVGIKPDVVVKAKKEEYESEDPVIRKAIQVLKGMLDA